MRRLERGAIVPAPETATEAAETSAPPGSVRLAVGGHPACLDRCAGAAGQGYAPDAHLRAAIERVRTMVAAGNGPAALLIGGGRASVGGDPLDLGGARRYREVTQGAGIPTYVLPGPGDLPSGGADAFAAAFASAPAPAGTAAAPDGVDVSTAPQPEPADAQRARKSVRLRPARGGGHGPGHRHRQRRRPARGRAGRRPGALAARRHGAGAHRSDTRRS